MFRGRIPVSIVLISLLAFPVQTIAQQTNPEVQYYVLGEKYPKGLGDFQAFGLFRKQSAGGRARFEGWVMTDRDDPNDSSVDMKSLRIVGRNLTFAAQTRKGIAFAFNGKFLRRGDFKPYFNKQIVVAEGTVRKFRRGRKLAEAKMRFTCGTGG